MYTSSIVQISNRERESEFKGPMKRVEEDQEVSVRAIGSECNKTRKRM